MNRLIKNFYFALNRRESIQNKIRLLDALTIAHFKRSGPRIFANTIPKSGTHLLTRCLSLMPDITYAGYFVNHIRSDGKVQDIKSTEHILKRISKGTFVAAHLPFSQDSCERLQKMAYKPILLIRDPRDVIISQLIFMMERHSNRWHEDFLPMSNEERLMALIEGVSGNRLGNGIAIPSVAELFDSYLLWGRVGKGHVVRFEDLIGEGGGGDDATQLAEVVKIADYLGISLEPTAAQHIAENIFYRRANTFRKGMIGDWKNYFSPEHKNCFKEIAGSLLIELGYESSWDW